MNHKRTARKNGTVRLFLKYTSKGQVLLSEHFIDSPFKYDIIFQRGALAQLAEQLTLNQ